MKRELLTRTMRHVLVIGIFLAVSIHPAPSDAESLLEKNFHYFQPPADGSGMVLTYGSEALTWLGMHYGLYADGAVDHLTVILDNDEEEPLIENQLGMNLMYAIGITRFVNVGLALPVVAYRTFNEDFEPEGADEMALEDLRVDVKGILFDRRRRCLGLALNLTGVVPLDRSENTFLSDNGFGVTPRLIADLGREWWTVALNVGYRYNTESESDVLDMEVLNELLVNLGATFRLGDYGQVLLDSAFRTPATKFFSDSSGNYGELMAAYRYFLGTYSHVALTAGAGMGILNGAGTPTTRVFLGVTVYEHHLERGR